MPKQRIKSAASQRGGAGYIGPIAIGSGYAVTKMLTVRWFDPELVPEVDFKLFLLAGLFLGIIIRPIFQRIYWYRRTSFVFVTIMLLLMGPVGVFPEYLLWGQVIDQLLLKRILTEMIPLVVVVLLASLILIPSQSQLTLADMSRRFLRQMSGVWWIRVFASAGGYVLLFLCFRVAFYSSEAWEAPLKNLSLFFTSSETPWMGKLVFLWGRGLLLVFAILPIHNVLNGKPHELTLVFGPVLFVVGDFMPLFANIYGQLPLEIIDQIIQRLFIDFLFCYAVMLLFHKPPFLTQKERTR